jgi:7,8-dihydroneopterin aldolase/epimerase/oxygenase
MRSDTSAQRVWFDVKIFLSKQLMPDKNIITIELNAATFFAFHGLYEEEKKTGGEFEVNLGVSYIADVTVIDKIEQTVNYVKLYELVKQQMQVPTGVLETVAMRITEEIKGVFPQVNEITIKIEKKYPPIHNFSGSLSVTYRKQY